MGKTLLIPRLNGAFLNTARENWVDVVKEFGTKGELTPQRWEPYYNYAQEITTTFALAYYKTTLFVHFRVEEEELRATYKNHGEAVSQDSCVEIFVQGSSERYANFECNPNGALLANIGMDRHSRFPLDPLFFQQLAIFPQIISDYEWEVLLALPLHYSGLIAGLDTLEGTKLKGNLYKCGDLLKRPHYLAWADIATPTPDFHRPEYFVDLVFL
ncbi:MAG: carbohydrate-binding family 9-like protein [Sphaerochaetaceae bacterium]